MAPRLCERKRKISASACPACGGVHLCKPARNASQCEAVGSASSKKNSVYSAIKIII